MPIDDGLSAEDFLTLAGAALAGAALAGAALAGAVAGWRGTTCGRGVSVGLGERRLESAAAVAFEATVGTAVTGFAAGVEVCGALDFPADAGDAVDAGDTGGTVKGVDDGEGRLGGDRSRVGAPPSATVSVKTLGLEGLGGVGDVPDPTRPFSTVRVGVPVMLPVDNGSGDAGATSLGLAVDTADDGGGKVRDDDDEALTAVARRLPLPVSERLAVRLVSARVAARSEAVVAGCVASQARSSAATSPAD